MTQCERILMYLREEGSITPLDAMREFGCMRLGARVYDLKRRGIGIRKETETRENRWGQKVRYARYYLEAG